jgi:hypothetical protein
MVGPDNSKLVVAGGIAFATVVALLVVHMTF